MLRLFKEFELYNNDDQINRIFSNPKGFSEPFFSELGAERIDSCGATDYEGATFAHDLNCELPEIPELKYDAVVDGGTLEHVFNFPIALKTSMKAVKIGGGFLKRLPAPTSLSAMARLPQYRDLGLLAPAFCPLIHDASFSRTFSD